MSKKKDPNIILRDKRLRDLVRQKKYAVKVASRFGCPFLDRIVEEDFELMERSIKLEHFVWEVGIEQQKDNKTGKVYAEIIVLGEFTDAANALDKKDRELLIRQHKYMAAYAAVLKQRVERICKQLEAKRKEVK